MTATVAIVGGGYAGITAAQALDDIADVVLIDPKECFVHNVASLRAVVDPEWADRMFMPYEKLLANGRIVQDMVVSVDPRGVFLASGHRIDADYIVIATGTTYPFPAKISTISARVGQTRIRRTAEDLSRVENVLLLGAGPVGLELAGEIKAVWPNKTVSIVDPQPQILSGGFLPHVDLDLQAKIRTELWRQLDELGVELLLGASLSTEPPTEATEPGRFTATLSTGRRIVTDMWFSCFGRKPVSGILSRELGFAKQRDGKVMVGPDLRIRHQRNVFVAGDVAASGGMDTVVVAVEEATFVAEQIKTLLAGGDRLDAYTPSQPIFLIPLGPHGGASYSPDAGFLDAETTAAYKGADLFVGSYREQFGLD